MTQHSVLITHHSSLPFRPTKEPPVKPAARNFETHPGKSAANKPRWSLLDESRDAFSEIFRFTCVYLCRPFQLQLFAITIRRTRFQQFLNLAQRYRRRLGQTL